MKEAKFKEVNTKVKDLLDSLEAIRRGIEKNKFSTKLNEEELNKLNEFLRDMYKEIDNISFQLKIDKNKLDIYHDQCEDAIKNIKDALINGYKSGIKVSCKYLKTDIGDLSDFLEENISDEDDEKEKEQIAKDPLYARLKELKEYKTKITKVRNRGLEKIEIYEDELTEIEDEILELYDEADLTRLSILRDGKITTITSLKDKDTYYIEGMGLIDSILAQVESLINGADVSKEQRNKAREILKFLPEKSLIDKPNKINYALKNIDKELKKMIEGMSKKNPLEPKIPNKESSELVDLKKEILKKREAKAKQNKVLNDFENLTKNNSIEEVK